MVGCFSLIHDQQSYHVPNEGLVEFRLRADVFALFRQGLIPPGATEVWLATPVGCRRLLREADAGTRIALRPHPMLAAPVFVCPGCQQDRYRLYSHNGSWACQRCAGLDWSSRHKHRSVPKLARLKWLRRRLKLSEQPFSPIPPRPRSHARYNRIADEIRALEAGLVGHLGEINRVLERRVRRLK
jgi:hypothetical protein